MPKNRKNIIQQIIFASLSASICYSNAFSSDSRGLPDAHGALLNEALALPENNPANWKPITFKENDRNTWVINGFFDKALDFFAELDPTNPGGCVGHCVEVLTELVTSPGESVGVGDGLDGSGIRSLAGVDWDKVERAGDRFKSELFEWLSLPPQKDEYKCSGYALTFLMASYNVYEKAMCQGIIESLPHSELFGYKLGPSISSLTDYANRIWKPNGWAVQTKTMTAGEVFSHLAEHGPLMVLIRNGTMNAKGLTIPLLHWVTIGGATRNSVSVYQGGCSGGLCATPFVFSMNEFLDAFAWSNGAGPSSVLLKKTGMLPGRVIYPAEIGHHYMPPIGSPNVNIDQMHFDAEIDLRGCDFSGLSTLSIDITSAFNNI